MTMADNTIYDLLDEVNCADSCEAVYSTRVAPLARVF